MSSRALGREANSPEVDDDRWHARTRTSAPLVREITTVRYRWMRPLVVTVRRSGSLK
jgi:hypothetical protein